MALNQNASYGRWIGQRITGKTAGKTFYVSDALGTGASAQTLQTIMTPDDT